MCKIVSRDSSALSLKANRNLEFLLKGRRVTTFYSFDNDATVFTSTRRNFLSTTTQKGMDFDNNSMFFFRQRRWPYTIVAPNPPIKQLIDESSQSCADNTATIIWSDVLSRKTLANTVPMLSPYDNLAD